MEIKDSEKTIAIQRKRDWIRLSNPFLGLIGKLELLHKDHLVRFAELAGLHVAEVDSSGNFAA